MAWVSFFTTSGGSGAYESASVIFCPSTNIHFRTPMIAERLAGSLIVLGISSQVKLEAGYAFLPGAFVMDTRKSSGMVFAASAAAAVTLATLAFTKAPEEFFTVPYDILFWTA